MKIIPKLLNSGIGDNTFIADKTLLSTILGIWLLVYCFQKDISGIKSAAFWGVLGIIFYLILNIVNLLYSSWIEDIPEDKNINFINPQFTGVAGYDVWSCVACIILSFSFHTYAFSIYECLDTPDPKKMIVTSSIGIFISMLIYLLVGTIGYILYGNEITDSILDSLGLSSLGVLENISFIVNVVMSFPLTFSALKHYFMYLVEIVGTLIRDKCCRRKKKEELLEKGENNNTPPEERQASHTSSVEEAKNHHKEKEKEDNKNHAGNHNHNHNHHHNNNNHGHMEMIHIPDFLEYIIIFMVFLGIFYVANIYPNMKTVKLLYYLNQFRYSGYSEQPPPIYSASFSLRCTSSNFLRTNSST